MKCLSSPRHLQALVENKVPDEYEAQKLQYFIVNPKLNTLYFVFYDDRVRSNPLHIIEIHRKDLNDLPEKFLQFQLEQLEEVNKIVEELAF